MVQDQLVHPEKYASTANQHVTPLGFSDENYYFTSSSNLQINRLRELSETDLYKLMPREFWIDKYGELITKGQKKGAVAVDWAVVKSDLMNQCRTLGRFELTMVRGHGVWLDGGETVIHLGDRLSRNDEIIGLRDIKNSSHIYEFSRKLEPIHSEPLTDSEMTLFLDIVALLNYARPEQQMFFAGWLAVANVCGILSWRPHIWITGEQGSGKSTTIQYIVRPLTSALTKFYFKGATTEAGIRQAMGSSCAPVLFDEFESASHRAAGRIEQIIELFRQASSDDDGVTAKGTSSGEAMEYNPRFCSAVASIGTSLITNQDKARFTLIELMKIKGDASQLAKLQSLLVDLTPEYCARFLARMIQLVPVIQHNQRLLQKACARRHTHRFGQQYGTLLAGWCAVQHSRKISEAEADELAAKVKLEQEISSNQIPDHEECLQHLLQKQIRVDDLTTSIASILANDAKEPNWDALANQAWKDDPYWKMVKPRLASLGIIPSVIEKKQGFVVLSTHPELNSLFRETRWSRNWAQALARLPGAVPNKRVRDIGSDRVTGTWVPAELLQGLDKPTPPF